MQFIRKLWSNISTIMTAFAFAIIVWVSSVLSADPYVPTVYFEPIPLQIVGLADDQILVGDVQETVIVKLGAQESIWQQLNENGEVISATLDVSDLKAGEHFLSIDIDVNLSAVSVISVTPSDVRIYLENIVHIDKSIHAVTVGELATGFQADDLNLDALWVNISGPESAVERVDQVIAVLDISGKRDSVSQQASLQVLDSDGKEIEGLNLSPSTINISQEISQSPGYRDVAVTVDLIGNIEPGYKLTNISVSPTTVTLSYSDPQAVADMPGFVKTEVINLAGLTEDLEMRVLLVLPDGVSLESEEKTVLVQIGVAPIQSSDTFKIPIQIIGLTSGLEAILPYIDLDILISGPLPILETLLPDDILLVVDLTDYEIGAFLVTPKIESIPENLIIDTIISEVEIIIQSASEDL